MSQISKCFTLTAINPESTCAKIASAENVLISPSMSSSKFLIFILPLLIACNHIEAGDSLNSGDLMRIRKLNLLDKNERIYKFYSEFKTSVAGNYFTDKRLAKYWIDERDPSKNEISFAFYQDIKSIDTVYYAGATYSPYMLVTKKDNSRFKVCADGKKSEIKDFFEDALTLWAQNKDPK